MGHETSSAECRKVLGKPGGLVTLFGAVVSLSRNLGLLDAHFGKPFAVIYTLPLLELREQVRAPNMELSPCCLGRQGRISCSSDPMDSY